MSDGTISGLPVASVWSGHRVGFCLLTVAERQYVAYYDAHRHLTVAMRTLPEDVWHYHRLPSRQERPPAFRRGETSTILGWDSHNYVRMAVDSAGYLHLSGNMHVNGLTYFRSEIPYDPATLVQVSPMVGEQEDACTYPAFLEGPNDELVFHYRHGSSGEGNEIYNIYDVTQRTWRRLLDRPLLDGRGRMNAYADGPRRGPDGRYHMSWVWRDTSDCATNHDLSYAQSPDLVHWQTAPGAPVVLPITLGTPGVIVDPIPAGGGIINGTGRVGYDSQRRMVLAYHKHDEHGNTQAYAARYEGSGWRIVRLSNWQHRWWFEGRGSIETEIRLGTVTPLVKGRLALPFRHVRYGAMTWQLDEDSLSVVGVQETRDPWPPELDRPTLEGWEGMQVHWLADTAAPESGYYLRWETLPANRDRPRPEPYPPPSLLRVYWLGE